MQEVISMYETAIDKAGNHDDISYESFLARIQARFAARTCDSPLFTTDAERLWSVYLNSFPVDQRQYHNCHACRHFIERFGSLVVIDDAGIATSALWSLEDAPEMYKPAVQAMTRLIQRSRVTGVFISADKTWGSPITGIWRHFSVKPYRTLVHNRRNVMTANQIMASKREDYKTVQRALAEFSQPVIEQALTLLQTEALYLSHKVHGPAQFLYDLHVARSRVKGQARNNVTWKAVATAPDGFCHPRSSMIGTLLEDMAAGLNFSEISRRFAEKMHPLRYQRPQAPPSQGNIEQAEKLVEKMGITASLRRRFARLDEIKALWKPAPIKAEPSNVDGIFSHIKPKSAKSSLVALDIPNITITWEKFQRTVLPEALEIEFFAPLTHENYTALVTAVDPEAPPILQWDKEDQRNPVSWYLWHRGSLAMQWGLTSGQFHKVSAITLQPSMWYGGYEHQGAGVIFILQDAKESASPGLGLFPGQLKTELHKIRATLEAFSKAGKMEGADEATACGVMLQKGNKWKARFRVRTSSGTLEYKLDRWD